MKYVIDHDYHIHSKLSHCSNDPLQTKENILAYAEKNGLTEICLTDHFWDDAIDGANGFYEAQNYRHISAALPLPQGENVRFYFGCETDMEKTMTLGISKEIMDKFDFIIVPTTHLHMMCPLVGVDDTPENRAEVYIKRFKKLLQYDLPWHKVGIAHLTCSLIGRNWSEHLQVLDNISDDDFKALFEKAAEKGVGIELNFILSKYQGDEIDRVLRPYKIAKQVGCKFYFGSDAHHPDELENSVSNFKSIAEALDLTEDDKFRFHS